MCTGLAWNSQIQRDRLGAQHHRVVRAATAFAVAFWLTAIDGNSGAAPRAAEGRTDQDAAVAADGVSEPPWGKALEGLQFRLRTERSTWQAWQQPSVVLDVRNATERTIPAAELQQHLPPSNATALRLMREPLPGLSDAELYGLEVRMRLGADAVPELKPGETFPVPLLVLATSRDGEGLAPDQVAVGLGRKLPQAEPEFFSNLVPLRILPPGVRSVGELDTHLKRYVATGQPVDAGFIPSGTTVVDGERIIWTLVVRNPGPRRFSFTFGGDYRGAARHNRFQIEARDAAGELLPDPAGEFRDFGGFLMPRHVDPNRLTAETIDLKAYRKFPGPGRYSVSARFVLTDDVGFQGGKFQVPVEAKMELTILPPTAENVAGVLERELARCSASAGVPLQGLIDTVCDLGREAAVPGLARLAAGGTGEQRREAIRGLGRIPAEAALVELLKLERDPQLRAAALLALGSFRDDRALTRAAAALGGGAADLRQAAAAALGRMQWDPAAGELLRRLGAANSPDEAASIVAALGESRTRAAYSAVAAALGRKEDAVRRAAVSAVVCFAPQEAEAALRPYAADEDLNFRELVLQTLAETLHAPIEAGLLAPVIRSRRGQHTIGEAPRLLRLYADDKAAPTLVGCLDFADPSIRSYFNMVLSQDQLACRTGLAIAWIGDLNRDGTPEELQRNRETLTRLQAWVEQYRKEPWSEPPDVWRLPPDQQEGTWGPEVAGVRLRARLNCSVWPPGLPQVITLEIMGKNGSSELSQRPAVLELEVDGQWYAHDPQADMAVCGEWNAYKGHPQHSFQLTPHWKRISDGRPLELAAGKHTARLRLVPPPGTDRHHLVTSPPVEFRVIGGLSPRD